MQEWCCDVECVEDWAEHCCWAGQSGSGGYRQRATKKSEDQTSPGIHVI